MSVRRPRCSEYKRTCIRHLRGVSGAFKDGSNVRREVGMQRVDPVLLGGIRDGPQKIKRNRSLASSIMTAAIPFIEEVRLDLSRVGRIAHHASTDRDNGAMTDYLVAISGERMNGPSVWVLDKKVAKVVRALVLRVDASVKPTDCC
jgi:hypothetical protein